MAKIVKLNPAFAAGEGNKISTPKSNCDRRVANWKMVPGQVSEAVFQPNGKITSRLR
ncbi:MAG TPA: hypothetical protein VJH63_02190 [Candidatus Paceibacterota bacterium]